ncbi:unnamed protein product [Pleuronectes platessa]|uniref:Uncharacterized protein n=1 Tax=Pleuronectes platessa TaxID=8262 RepID=A0A9N7VVK2_PLEPL|nr:unnamed protein product [Pleuronectes platessa]
MAHNAVKSFKPSWTLQGHVHRLKDCLSHTHTLVELQTETVTWDHCAPQTWLLLHRLSTGHLRWWFKQLGVTMVMAPGPYACLVGEPGFAGQDPASLTGTQDCPCTYTLQMYHVFTCLPMNIALIPLPGPFVHCLTASAFSQATHHPKQRRPTSHPPPSATRIPFCYHPSNWVPLSTAALSADRQPPHTPSLSGCPQETLVDEAGALILGGYEGETLQRCEPLKNPKSEICATGQTAPRHFSAAPAHLASPSRLFAPLLAAINHSNQPGSSRGAEREAAPSYEWRQRRRVSDDGASTMERRSEEVQRGKEREDRDKAAEGLRGEK